MVYDDDLLNKHDLSSDSCAVLALVFLLFSLEAFMLLHWLRLGGNFLKNPHENVEPFLLFVARRLLSGEFSAQEIRCARANFFGTFYAFDCVGDAGSLQGGPKYLEPFIVMLFASSHSRLISGELRDVNAHQPFCFAVNFIYFRSNLIKHEN